MPQGLELSACCCWGSADPWPQCQRLPRVPEVKGRGSATPSSAPRPRQWAPALQREASSCSGNAKCLRQQLGCGVAHRPFARCLPAPALTWAFLQLHFHHFIIPHPPTPPPPSCDVQSWGSVRSPALGSAPSPARQTASAAGTRHACWGLSPSPSVRAVSPPPCREAMQ